MDLLNLSTNRLRNWLISLFHFGHPNLDNVYFIVLTTRMWSAARNVWVTFIVLRYVSHSIAIEVLSLAAKKMKKIKNRKRSRRSLFGAVYLTSGSWTSLLIYIILECVRRAMLDIHRHRFGTWRLATCVILDYFKRSYFGETFACHGGWRHAKPVNRLFCLFNSLTRWSWFSSDEMVKRKMPVRQLILLIIELHGQANLMWFVSNVTL